MFKALINFNLAILQQISLNFGQIKLHFVNSTYMRVNDFVHFLCLKNVIRLIRGSTYTRVYTVLVKWCYSREIAVLVGKLIKNNPKRIYPRWSPFPSLGWRHHRNLCSKNQNIFTILFYRWKFWTLNKSTMLETILLWTIAINFSTLKHALKLA